MRRAAAFVILIVMASILFPVSGQAEEGIQVRVNTFKNNFPQGMLFRLEAQSPDVIHRITLQYGTVGGKFQGTAYGYPEFTPGLSVKAEFTLNTRKAESYLPPGTEITYHWVVEDQAGRKQETEPTAFSYDDVRFSWRKVSKSGVTFYYYAGSEASARELLDAAVASVERLSRQAGIAYNRPMKIIAYASKQDMDPALQQRSETFSREIVTLGQRASAEVMLLMMNHREVKETIAHEVSHMVIHQVAEGPFGSLPAWLDEGLAMNAELEVPRYYLADLDVAIRRDALISVRSLSGYSGEPRDVTLFYGESYSIVKFLLEQHGQERMNQLLKVFREGSNQDDALMQVYGFDVEGLDDAWRKQIGAPPRPASERGVVIPTAQPIPVIVPFGTAPTPLPEATSAAAPRREAAPSAGSLPPLLIAGGVLSFLVLAAFGATATLLLLRRRS